MKGLLQWGMILMAWALLAGCSESGRSKPVQPPVTAAAVPGDLTYQDVVQKGEVVHNLSMTPDAQHIWVGTHAGLYHSTGGGAWGSLSTELEQEDVTGWFVDPNNPQRIFAAGNSGVLQSTDGGKKWSKVGKGLPEPADIRSFAGIREGDQIRLFAFVTGEGIYQSSNAGKDWSLWLPLDQEVYAMDYDPMENRLYVAAQFNLLYHEDGQWKTEVVPNAQQVYSLTVDRTSGILAVATDRGIMEKIDGIWQQLDAKSPETLIVIAPGAGEYRWVGIGESAFVYTLSNGKWKKWN
ncbi:hypothetical protein [Brevibacillus borstelensis]|uniref:WD40/YVTN/BNR-like repeat-containing protein n=1 Tax=Brevibacillus borstelensis TaxID=45462 RepID=UPI0030C4DF09